MPQTGAPRRSGSAAGGMCGAGGRVREGNPPWYGQVRTWFKTPTRGGGLIASRIPPGRLVWLLGGWVVFFVLVVFFVFYVFVELVAVLGFLLVVGLLSCWAVAT